VHHRRVSRFVVAMDADQLVQPLVVDTREQCVEHHRFVALFGIGHEAEQERAAAAAADEPAQESPFDRGAAGGHGHGVELFGLHGIALSRAVARVRSRSRTTDIIVNSTTDNLVNNEFRGHDRPVATRRRRSAEEARAEILDAAERRLSAAGPSALRLQEVAADVGISHPAVLHHFGSREALVQAVVERAMQNLEQDLVRSIAGANAGTPDSAALLDRVFETLADRGHARLMAWLMLSGYEPLGTASARANWMMIARATHSLRPKNSNSEGPAGFEDTMFTVVLSALALFGQAIAGPGAFDLASLGDDPEVAQRFRRWLGELLVRHLER
jgi:AcrR family transcriptional regulator